MGEDLESGRAAQRTELVVVAVVAKKMTRHLWSVVLGVDTTDRYYAWIG